jgi:hypothetical protein
MLRASGVTAHRTHTHTAHRSRRLTGTTHTQMPRGIPYIYYQHTMQCAAISTSVLVPSPQRTQPLPGRRHACTWPVHSGRGRSETSTDCLAQRSSCTTLGIGTLQKSPHRRQIMVSKVSGTEIGAAWSLLHPLAMFTLSPLSPHSPLL